MSLLIMGTDLLGQGRADLLVTDGVITEVGSLGGATADDPPSCGWGDTTWMMPPPTPKYGCM